MWGVSDIENWQCLLYSFILWCPWINLFFLQKVQQSVSYSVVLRFKILMPVIHVLYRLSWKHLCRWNWDVNLSLADADFFSRVKFTFVVGRMILLNYENTRPIWLASVIFPSSSFRTGFPVISSMFSFLWNKRTTISRLYKQKCWCEDLLFYHIFFVWSPYEVIIMTIINIFRFLPC